MLMPKVLGRLLLPLTATQHITSHHQCVSGMFLITLPECHTSPLWYCVHHRLHDAFFAAAEAAGLKANPDFNEWSRSQVSAPCRLGSVGPWCFT